MLYHPVEVTLCDPFTASLVIDKGLPDKLEAAITLTSAYKGLDMKDISAFPLRPRNIAVEPERQTLDLGKRRRFRLDYLRESNDAPKLRAVTMIVKLREHIVRLRTVMEVALDPGVQTRTSGIWMNECADGLTVAASEGGRKCRKTTANRAGSARYMYFAVSPNLPTSGNTYITVTYYDHQSGSFRLQYDSSDEDATMEGAYKECHDSAKLMGTHTWKQKTFVVDDARFLNR
ncbi:MAG: hypothetical protein GTN51_11360, partial [Armatimonadetes bacterium]|nr:hypothetical protein [Armatimonadota bacterium]